MIKLTLKPEYVDCREEANLREADVVAGPACAALREVGVEISAADFCDAWSEHSTASWATWISFRPRDTADNLNCILPYCDVEPGDPRADLLIAHMGEVSKVADVSNVREARLSLNVIREVLAQRPPA